VRDALKSYYLEEGRFNEFQVEIPKGGYIPVYTLLKKGESGHEPGKKIVEPNRDKPRGKAILAVAIVSFVLGCAAGYCFSALRYAAGSSGPYIEVYYPKEIYSHTHVLFGHLLAG
jgi:hypothetical protein